MKLTCPDNPKHKKFVATAHVTQDWVIDTDGDFLKRTGPEAIETTHSPDADDCINCFVCGADAEVTR